MAHIAQKGGIGMINQVTEYRVPPGTSTTIGVDLGQPVRIYQPESLVQRGPAEPTIISKRKARGGKANTTPNAKQKRFRIGKEEYLQARKSGVSRDAICNRYNIAIGTLRTYLAKWGILAREAEEAALRELGE